MQKVTLKASGSQAPTDMPPGEWIIRCEHGEISRRGNQISAVLACIVLGHFTDKGFTKENEGVVLKQWYFLARIDSKGDDVVLDIHPHSKYGTAWALAMGRPLKSTDEPNPSAFEKKIFRVDVGYRSDAGGSFSYKNVGKKKDPKDFLRIHTIMEKIEEKDLSHMTSLSQWGHKHVHVTEHEHDARASTVTSTPASTDSKSIRSIGASHMSNEPGPKGHANEEPGQPTKDSPGSPTPEDLAEDWDEAAILRTKGAVSLEKIRFVKQVFPGARVVEKPAEQQFQLLKTARHS